MADTDAGTTAADFASVLEQTPGKAASAETSHGHFALQGVEAGIEAVRRARDEPVDDGMLDVDEADPDRYRLVDRGAR